MVSGGAAVTALVARDGSWGWRLVRVLVAAGSTSGALLVLKRSKAPVGGRVVAVFGIVTFTIGLGFVPHLVKNGLSVTAIAAVAAVLAGLAATVAGSLVASTERRTARRLGTSTAAVLTAAVVAWTVAPSIMATNVPRTEIGATPASKGLAYESPTLTTVDGIRLAAWYVPGDNRAAVVLLHGAGSTRSNVLDEATVLAAHGFGVLLVDARGHGDSGGRAMDFGWYGDRDIEAATRFLAGRAEVDRGRIAVMGMSMGGEEALGASGTNSLIKAVVAEGATARSAADKAWLSDVYGWRGVVQEHIERVQGFVTDALTSASAPISSRRAVELSATTRYLIIAAGTVEDEIHAAEHVAAAAPDRVETWTVPGSGHTAGLRTAPQEWERRVITFLTSALLSDVSQSSASQS